MPKIYSRRNFIKLACVTGLGLLGEEVGLIRRPHPTLDGATFGGNPEGEGSATAFGGVEAEDINIIQSGITSVEIDGHKFKVEFDPKAIKEIILYEAGQQNDPSMVKKTEEWLAKNTLQVQIYRYELNPLLYLAGGYFISPEFNLGNAKIAIPDTQISSLYRKMADREQGPNNRVDDGKPENQLDPLIIFPHEALHLLEYIKSPYIFLAKLAARVSEVLISSLAAQAQKAKMKQDGIGRMETSAIGLVRFGQTMIMFNLLNIIFGLDQHSSLPTHGILAEKIYGDPKYTDLARRVIKFTPED